jgi:hypothetical protein
MFGAKKNLDVSRFGTKKIFCRDKYNEARLLFCK